jgi:hypothetical protein
MLEKKEILIKENNLGVEVANSQLNQQPIILLDEFEKVKNKEKVTIKGTLTSRIEVKPSSDIPAYGFFKFDNQEQEIPVIFRIKENGN